MTIWKLWQWKHIVCDVAGTAAAYERPYSWARNGELNEPRVLSTTGTIVICFYACGRYNLLRCWLLLQQCESGFFSSFESALTSTSKFDEKRASNRNIRQEGKNGFLGAENALNINCLSSSDDIWIGCKDLHRFAYGLFSPLRVNCVSRDFEYDCNKFEWLITGIVQKIFNSFRYAFYVVFIVHFKCEWLYQSPFSDRISRKKTPKV